MGAFSRNSTPDTRMQSQSLANKIIVGISGGVDSSVAALTLLEQGYEVEGLFMKNWEEDDDAQFCSATEDLADAQAVCDKLDIKLHAVNFATEYWDRVFEYFLDEYRAGRTPNPDIMCNKEIKFKAFLEFAQHLGAAKIATGHYARIGNQGDEYQLLTGLDKNKDQSYFLYALQQPALSKSLFPLGAMDKPDVRKKAEEAGLVTHDKKDSTGICFIGERKFSTFLERFLPAQPGVILSDTGEQVGQHNGLMFYTIGQRHGLGIGGRKGGDESPWFVYGKNLPENQLLVCQGHQHPCLMAGSLTASQITWAAGHPPAFPAQVEAKIRYRQAAQPCSLSPLDDEQLAVQFNEPQRAIAPGQSVVFYQDEICLGGGIIEYAGLPT